MANEATALTSPNFDTDTFISDLLKQKSLEELLLEEDHMLNSIRRLDSDVHQIVYENYNKFLTATHTVRKIESELSELDSEMSSLSDSMERISVLVKQLAGVMRGGKTAVLAHSHRTVTGIQFIFDLPRILQELLDAKKHSELVRIYGLAKLSLKKYEDLENVKDIVERTREIAECARRELEERVGSLRSVDNAGEAVSLLLELGVEATHLEGVILDAMHQSLENDLSALPNCPDVLALVEGACSSFLPNLALVASFFRSHFPSSDDRLLHTLTPLMERMHRMVEECIVDGEWGESGLVVRALDRYYRKCTAIGRVLPELNTAEACFGLVDNVSSSEIAKCRRKIREEIRREIEDASVALEQSFLFHLKTALADLLLFTATDVAFSSRSERFACKVYEEVVAGSLLDVSHDCVNASPASSDSFLQLALFVNQLASKCGQLLRLCVEQYGMDGLPVTEESLSKQLKERAHQLLQMYAHHVGLSVGEEWANAISDRDSAPTGVSEATLRLVKQLRKVFDTVTEALQGDTRRADVRGRRPRGESVWCERIDLRAHLHFNPESISMSILNRVLKCGVESVRLCSFSAFSVQQMQVDTAFIQQLAVSSDEPVSLLDQLLSATLRRCLQPNLLHPNVVSSFISQALPE